MLTPRKSGKKTVLPKPKRIYLRPISVPHQPGVLVPGRGQLRRVPFQKERALGRLEIRELPDGSIEIPHFEFDSRRNELVKRGKSVFPTINDALRSMGWHIPQSVREETGRMHRLYNQLREFHGITAEHWNRMNESQRKLLMRKVTLALRHLSENPALLRSKTKIKARDRIVRATELLKKGNQMAALLSLSGAANDALQRFNELIGQRPFLSRRERSLREFKTGRERVVFVGLRQLVGEFGKIGRLSGMSNADRIHFFKTIDAWKRYFGAPQRAKIQNFRLASEQLANAISQAQNGRFSEAKDFLRQSTRLIALEISKTGDLYGDMIQLVGQSKDKAWTKQIMKQQAQLVAENLEYWTQQGFPKGFGDRHAFFTEWAKVANSNGQKAIARRFIRARTAFNNQDIARCQNELEKIAEILS